MSTGSDATRCPRLTIGAAALALLGVVALIFACDVSGNARGPNVDTGTTTTTPTPDARDATERSAGIGASAAASAAPANVAEAAPLRSATEMSPHAPAHRSKAAVSVVDATTGAARSADAGVPSTATTTTAATNATDATSTSSSLRAWDTIVAPIFSVRCAGCHGAEKRKAKMRLDTYDGVMRGGEDGKVVVPGDASASMMMKRLTLPLDDDDHMPPKKKPQPSAAEIEVLRWWINHGATRDLALDAGTLAPSVLADADAAVQAARRAQAQ